MGIDENFWISHFAAKKYTPEELDTIVTSCTSVRASVDAPDIDTYNIIRKPGNTNAFNIMKTNVAGFVEARKRTDSNARIGIQMVLLKENIDKIEEMVRLAEELGVDYIQLRPVEPTGDYKDEQGVPVGITTLGGFYNDLNTLRALGDLCDQLQETTNVHIMYRADKVAGMSDEDLSIPPARPAQKCGGSLFQGVIQFKETFDAELLHCYFRDELAVELHPGKLSEIMYSRERSDMAQTANETPLQCSVGCKYALPETGVNVFLEAMENLSKQQRLVTIDSIIQNTGSIKDPHIL